jgi:hypothetical protein
MTRPTPGAGDVLDVLERYIAAHGLHAAVGLLGEICDHRSAPRSWPPATCPWRAAAASLFALADKLRRGW